MLSADNSSPSPHFDTRAEVPASYVRALALSILYLLALILIWNGVSSWLVTSSDISHMQSLARPVRFREVRTGYIMSSATEKQYMLCGSFSPAQEKGEPRWIPFVTIKTSGYEQYLGAQAVGFCTRSSVTWEKRDLSSALQSRFESTR